VSAACGPSAPDLRPVPISSAPLTAAPGVAWQGPRNAPEVPVTPRQPPTDAADAPSPPWLAELLNAPDPEVRLQGLEAWARQPGDSLDPATYALVDPDESVRARAQELFEQALDRR